MRALRNIEQLEVDMHCSWVLSTLCLAVWPLTVDAAGGEVSIKRGLQVSITGGCHDCHTPGYVQAEGKIDPSVALKGSPMGFRGPWGTTYALNLRLTVVEKAKTEEEFVTFAKTLRTRPPMPWFNMPAMDESDLRSLFLYIKSLGAPGEQAPEAVGPDEEPKTPYLLFEPTLPKG